VDIGNMRYSSIDGYKFLDAYGPDNSWPNGVRDPGESGLGNWHITLEGRTVKGKYVFAETWTKNFGALSDIGYYCFGKLLPGTYWVNETVLTGWVPTKTSVNLIVVPAYPWGPPVRIVVDFANMLPDADPAMTFTLKRGWNLWSTPLDVPGLTAKSLLAAIGPKATVVSQLNKTSGKYDSYLSVSPIRYNFAVVLGHGYYIWSLATCPSRCTAGTCRRASHTWPRVGTSSATTGLRRSRRASCSRRSRAAAGPS
jgi:hypothetical protein